MAAVAVDQRGLGSDQEYAIVRAYSTEDAALASGHVKGADGVYRWEAVVARGTDEQDLRRQLSGLERQLHLVREDFPIRYEYVLRPL